jgi:hypothetical protein
VKLWHKMELISTSLCCERLVYEPSRTDQDVLMEADGMAGPSLADALQLYDDGSSVKDELIGSSSSGIVEASSSSSSTGVALPPLPLLPVPAAGFVANNVVPFPSSRATSPTSSSSSSSDAIKAAAAAYSAAQAAATAQQQAAISSSTTSLAITPAGATTASSSSSSKKGWNPADLVAAKLSEAAAAASAAALQPLASAAGSLYAGSLSLVSSVTSSVTSSVISSSVSSFGPAFGPAADRAVRETIAGITSAEIAGSHPNGKEVKAASSSTGTKCPSEWFVCDDEASATRYFVIQGSDSLDHWKTNLMFEPIVFEDEGLGVKVHRGAYEAAQALYERFLPLVQEQVDSDPCARVAFTVSGWA